MKRNIFKASFLLLAIICLFSGCGLTYANAKLFSAKPIKTDNKDGTASYVLSSAHLCFEYPSDWKPEEFSADATIAIYPGEDVHGKAISASVSIVRNGKEMTMQEHLSTAAEKLEKNVEGISFVKKEVIDAQHAVLMFTVDYDGIPTTEAYSFTDLLDGTVAMCGITAPTADYPEFKERLELILNSVKPYYDESETTTAA